MTANKAPQQKKKAMFAWYGYIEPYQQRIAHIKEAGFDGISLWWEDEADCTCSRMVDEAKKLDLDIIHVHAPSLPEDDLAIDSCRSKYLTKIKSTITAMADKNLHHLVLHICDHPTNEQPSVAYLKDLEELIVFAEREKTLLSMENTYSIQYLTAIFDSFPSPYLGLCYDTSHGKIRQQESLLKNYGSLITACHISDNDGINDSHSLPFDGTIAFKPIMEILKNSSADYVLEVTANTKQYPKSNAFTAEAFKRLQQLILK